MSSRLGVAAAVSALLATMAAPAYALIPVRTGWWNSATVAGDALPSTTASGDLHVANGPRDRLAFAAVSFHTAPFSRGTLTLQVVANSSVGTPTVLACPTVDDAWKDGGDQPDSAAPSYTCAGRSAVGIVGTTTAGTTLTFNLSPTQELSLGVTSLAIVPDATVMTPFSFDVAKPTDSAFVIAPLPGPTSPSSFGGGSGGVGSSVGGSGPTNGIALGTVSGGTAPVPASSPDTVTVVAAVPPTVASPGAADARGSSPIATRPLSSSDLRQQLTAVLLLLLLVGGLGYLAASQPVPALRLLGGRAPRGADGKVRTPGDPLGEGEPRGIGRFARPRNAPPRGLS